MDGTDALTIEIAGELANVAREEWDSLANPPDAPYDPFLSWDFLQGLEESGCASATRRAESSARCRSMPRIIRTASTCSITPGPTR
jgi:predicted N-acyltransferase